MMILPILSPYSEVFYNEWLLSPTRSDYNMVFDCTLDGNVDVERFKYAIRRFISDHAILNSHVVSISNSISCIERSYSNFEKFDQTQINNNIKFNTEKNPTSSTLHWQRNKDDASVDHFEEALSANQIDQYVKAPFDLHQGPLFKFCLIRNGNDEYRFVAVFHHIVMDGTSINYFITELSKYYNDKKYKIRGSIAQQLMSAADFSQSILEYNKLHREESMSFWREKLNNTESLAFDFLKLKSENFVPNNKAKNDVISINSELVQVKEIRFSFGTETLNDFKEVQKIVGVSSYLYSQIIFAILIYRYTGLQKFCVSYPFSIKKGEDLIYGSQVNTLLLPYDFSEQSLTILDVLQNSIEFIRLLKNSGVADHRKIPFSEIVQSIPDISIHDILGCSFAQTTLNPLPPSFYDHNQDLIKVRVNASTSINIVGDLVFQKDNADDDLIYRVKYNANKINSFLLAEFVESYKDLFLKILKDLTQYFLCNPILNSREISTHPINEETTFSLKKLPCYTILSPNRYNQILETYNDTEAFYPENKTIHRLFEEQVERTPDAIAVIYEDRKVSYRELNERANRLANHLILVHDIKPDTLVPLLLDRSEHMIISILAVLKAGGAYVPLDPDYPDERIQYVLSDIGVSSVSKGHLDVNIIVMTNNVHNARLQSILRLVCNSRFSMLTVDSMGMQRTLESMLPTNPDRQDVLGANLAYVIYTSGTTGKPKGVMIEHRGVVNLIYSQPTELGFENAYDNIESADSKHCLWYASYVFDAHIWEVYSCILHGHRLYILDNALRKNIKLLNDFIDSNRIDTGLLPPVILDEEQVFNIDLLVVGGSQINSCVLQNYLMHNVRVVNAYGPTETTVYSTKNIYINAHSSNIGRPISNTKVYVLCSNLRPLPIGAVGELHIGGVGLARGYLNQPGLTDERFISNPFQTEEERNDKTYGARGRNARIYKTGDLVRWLPCGNLEYIGRNDFQVKIHGYRIELGEIESVLSQYPEIKQCVVLIRERKLETQTDSTSQKYLVAYYTSVSGLTLDEDEVLSYLQTKLSSYMIPSSFIHLERFPLTINGKLDRKALPDPEFKGFDICYVAPRNELENKICQIWGDVLGIPIEKIGIKDDFFRLGGDSIVSIQVVSKLRQQAHLRCSVKDVFIYKTIEKLYDNVVKPNLDNDRTKYITANPEEDSVVGKALLLPIQEWFFENKFNAPHHWNQSFAIKTPHLDIERLQMSLSKLILHHDSFRLRYKKPKKTCNKYVQYYDINVVPEKIRTLDIKTLKENEGSEEFANKIQKILKGWY